MANRIERSSPCVEFALLDVTDPEQVPCFIIWLATGNWPGDRTIRELLLAPRQLTAEESQEFFWGDQAPRWRMARLLWQFLQRDRSDRSFTGWAYKEDCARCADLLPPVQQKLSWVLAGIQEIASRDAVVNQGDWGEEWFLPAEQADYVRQQLGRSQLTLLERESEYPEALALVFEYNTRHQAGFIDISITDDDRSYVGEYVQYELGLLRHVWIEAGGQRQSLPNSGQLRRPPGSNFYWAYSGLAARNLAESILTDATGGDLALAYEHSERFLDEVVAQLPEHEPFRLSRAGVLAWLQKHGVDDQQLADSQQYLTERKKACGPTVERLKKELEKALAAGLRVQRFDNVPPDFECALYLDLMQMLQHGKRIMRCSRCTLPIPYDASGRSNRQRARWVAGQPIYHQQCWHEARREIKRRRWRRRATDADFKEERRRRAREARRLP